VYETWVAIERSIKKFDRLFNKVEKFDARKFSDPFQTDLENEPEDSYVEDLIDRREIAAGGDLDPKRFAFIETGLQHEVHENFEDIVEDKIFKFKYRQNADTPQIYARRMKRVISRFAERATKRDPALEADLFDLYS